jgi:hypothetical protein
MCVRDYALEMGLCILLEVQVGCNSGIFSFSRLMALDVLLWYGEHCSPSVGKDKEGNVFLYTT